MKQIAEMNDGELADYAFEMGERVKNIARVVCQGVPGVAMRTLVSALALLLAEVESDESTPEQLLEQTISHLRAIARQTMGLDAVTASDKESLN